MKNIVYLAWQIFFKQESEYQFDKDLLSQTL